jgi:hypothetical protein
MPAEIPSEQGIFRNLSGNCAWLKEASHFGNFSYIALLTRYWRKPNCQVRIVNMRALRWASSREITRLATASRRWRAGSRGPIGQSGRPAARHENLGGAAGRGAFATVRVSRSGRLVDDAGGSDLRPTCRPGRRLRPESQTAAVRCTGQAPARRYLLVARPSAGDPARRWRRRRGRGGFRRIDRLAEGMRREAAAQGQVPREQPPGPAEGADSIDPSHTPVTSSRIRPLAKAWDEIAAVFGFDRYSGGLKASQRRRASGPST